MTDIISIIGTRPEAIRVMRDLSSHMIVNTGQHYDDGMDAMFWRERSFEPDLNIGAKTFSEIYERVDELLKMEKPKLVISYGDTRSSFIAALAAKDNGIRVAHLEAGVRCYDMRMPEERYRIMTDSISDYLFAINKKCEQNLLKENVQGKIFVVGDLLYDIYLGKRKHGNYVLMTIHRRENQDSSILKSIFKKYEGERIIFPAHPVIRKFIGSDLPANLEILEPVGHNRMIELIRDAKLVVTDSGGVQREAFFMGVPLDVRLMKNPLGEEISVFGDGHAGERIRKILVEELYGNR